MKKQLLSVLSLLTVSFAVAQPTFNHSDVAPQAGDVYVQIMSNVVPSPGNSGANQTWNLSSMTPGGSLSNTITTMASSPHAANFPNATFQGHNGTDYQFYNTASSKYMLAGNVAGGITMAYSDQEEIMQFPMTFYNQFVDTWAVTYVAGSLTMNRTATSTVLYDGHGTVTTPAGTFSNAARMKTVQVMNDANQFATVTQTLTMYNWWVLGERYPLAQVVSAANSFTTINYAWYRTLAANPVGLDENGQLANALNIYPNPASDIVYLNSHSNETVTLDMYNLNGDLVLTTAVEKGNPSVSLSVAHLAEGVYMAKVKTGSLTETKKLVIRH